MKDYSAVLACVACDEELTVAHLGPLRVRAIAIIPLSGGWVLDELDGKQNAWCPRHGEKRA